MSSNKQPMLSAEITTFAYECFICFEPMTTDQDLIRNRTGIITHRACMEDDDDD